MDLYINCTLIGQCLARLEAYIDFSEDQNLDSNILISVKQDINVLKFEISAHLQDKRKGEKLRNGVFTVLIGKPNVGKSSLLNSLCRRDIAIVSATAGTTRDIIESSLNLDGYLVTICDTAGIRESPDAIEQEGVKRAKDRSSKADVIVFIVEAKRALDLLGVHRNEDAHLVEHLLHMELGENFLSDLPHPQTGVNGINVQPSCCHETVNTVVLLNKTDLLSEDEKRKVRELEDEYPSVCAVSCTDGTGMPKFINLFSGRIKDICCGHRGEEPTITQDRHRQYVSNCLQNILEYEECLEVDVAIAADKLRGAMNELGKITGKIRTNDILDVVFKDFCIGK